MVNKNRPTGNIEDRYPDMPFKGTGKDERRDEDGDLPEQDWESHTTTLDRKKGSHEQEFGDYGDGTFGGFMEGDTLEHGIQDYRREVVKAKRGATHPNIKNDPALEPAFYNCGVKGCNDRLLIGIRNDGHINYAINTIRRVGWAFRQSDQLFYCPEHRHIAQPLVEVKLYAFFIKWRIFEMIVLYNVWSGKYSFHRWWFGYNSSSQEVTGKILYANVSVWMVPGTYDIEGNPTIEPGAWKV